MASAFLQDNAQGKAGGGGSGAAQGVRRGDGQGTLGNTGRDARRPHSLQHGHALVGDSAQQADGQTRAGERVAENRVPGQTKDHAQGPNLHTTPTAAQARGA
jgi:hypothetical protein